VVSHRCSLSWVKRRAVALRTAPTMAGIGGF
jgi:hypothetical protein